MTRSEKARAAFQGGVMLWAFRGAAEEALVALACSDAPEGREHRTMRVLADKLIQLEVVDEVSDETVRRA